MYFVYPIYIILEIETNATIPMVCIDSTLPTNGPRLILSTATTYIKPITIAPFCSCIHIREKLELTFVRNCNHRLLWAPRVGATTIAPMYIKVYPTFFAIFLLAL